MSSGVSIRVVEAQRVPAPVNIRSQARPREVSYNLVVMPSARELGVGVAGCLRVNPFPVSFKTFGDQETYHQLESSTEGKPTFVVWSPRHTADHFYRDIFDMQNIGYTLSRSVEQLHAVFPHIPFLTQDRIDKPRSCLSAAAIIDTIKSSGYQYVTTLDMHTSALETAFAVAKLKPAHFFSSPIFSRFLLALTKSRIRARELTVLGLLPHEGKPRGEAEIAVRLFDPGNFISASTDIGGHKRALLLAQDVAGRRLADARVSVVIKNRDVNSGALSLSSVIGPNLKGKTVVLIDDLLRSAKTLVIAIEAIKQAGAAKVIACATHPEMDDGAAERLQEAQRRGLLDLVVTTNSIEVPAAKRFRGLTQIMLDPILAAVIDAEANRRSTSAAFHEVLLGRPLQLIRYE